MSKYELDDELVLAFLDTLHESEDELPSGRIGGALEKQLPIPAPTKIGAMVRTPGFPSAFRPEPLVFIRWATDSHTVSPWIEASDHEQPYRTDEIGRVVEILSEGVDL